VKGPAAPAAQRATLSTKPNEILSLSSHLACVSCFEARLGSTKRRCGSPVLEFNLLHWPAPTHGHAGHRPQILRKVGGYEPDDDV